MKESGMLSYVDKAREAKERFPNDFFEVNWIENSDSQYIVNCGEYIIADKLNVIDADKLLDFLQRTLEDF